MVRQALTTLLLLATSLAATAQNAIVEESTTDVVCHDATHATTQHRKVVTILNEQGQRHAVFVCSCSKNERLTSFHGQVADATGRILRRIRQSDLERTEYSPYLAIDDYQVYYDYTPPVFPVTITYEWTTDSRNTLIEFPGFCPQDNYGVAVKKATYRLTVPGDMPVRHAVQNMAQTVVTTRGEKGTQVLTLELSDLPALRQEPYSRPLHERMPMAYFAPRDFTYYGTQGSLTDWAEYGRWEYSLLAERDLLPADVRAEVHRLTDQLPTAREKVQRLYQYLEQTTRYVAVLLGIGGQQPAPAQQVSKSGFGDCKGLSNYLRAMLKEIGIASNYTTISTRNRRLLTDFASVGQLNHVILQVPLPQDTLWLECTNAQLPFGYVHEDIAGHDAITIGSDGGRLVRLPAYADTTNTQRSRILLTVGADGCADIGLRQTSRNRQYEHRNALLKVDDKERLRTLQRMVRAPQVSFTDVSVRQDEGASITLTANLHSQRYASQTGQRLFVPLCPIHQGYSAPSMNGERTEPLCIDMGYLDEDSISIRLPEGYAVEARPQNVTIEKPFGTFSLRLSADDDGTLHVNYRLLVRAGSYGKAQYNEFVEFIKSVASAYGQKVVLRKRD